MSIPPLVCSTPPPPDKCEDDRDPDEYDLEYNLSQDEETNDIECSNLDRYSHNDTSYFNNPSDHIEQNIDNTGTLSDKDVNEDLCDPVSERIKQSENMDLSNKNEDNFIEDLNLKVEVRQHYSKPNDLGEEELINEVINKDDSVLSTTLGNINASEGSFDSIREKCVKTIGPPLHNCEQSNDYTTTVDIDNFDNSPGLSGKNLNDIVKDEFRTINEVDDVQNYKDNESIDFEDIMAPEICAEVAFTCDNPWENNDTVDQNFGDFEANFESNDKIMKLSDTAAITNTANETVDVNEHTNNGEDDDFGDFDEFQSSSEKPENETQEFSVFNVHSSMDEKQIFESLDKIFGTLFQDAITEQLSKFEGKLESYLCETWGHLMDVDERQPYIIQWNNSLGQKTILKALCIDSRNILFAPKWSYNTPKFAANLGYAPLQPQKQNTINNTSGTDTDSDKNTSKHASNWTESLSSDGPESGKSESEVNKNSVADQVILNTTETTKANVIYSDTPIRQISLPDTHIFTPTDSETPRSKTIHYNDGPPRLIPDKSNPEHSIVHTETNLPSKNDNFEYTEFQDYTKANLPSEPVTIGCKSLQNTDLTNVSKSDNSTVYHSQILQPIKVETLTPTLNWPDPGVIKETFDDFTDFVSSSSTIVTSLGKESSHMNETSSNSKTIPQPINGTPFLQQQANELAEKWCDDEFDTFQSALPPSTNSEALDKGIILQVDSSCSTLEEVTHKENNLKILTKDEKCITSDAESKFPISFKSHVLPLSTHNQKVNEIQSNILSPLQPVPAISTATNQQSAGQILQPLSLESYSQINWPNPGIDLQDLSKFNPVETLNSRKADLSSGSNSKTSSPIHTVKTNAISSSGVDDDIWGEFVSSQPKQMQQQILPKAGHVLLDDEEWTDFVSSPSVKPQNGLNTISLNVHTNLNLQKATSQIQFSNEKSKMPVEFPTLNIITPKSSNHRAYNDRHFQNL